MGYGIELVGAHLSDAATATAQAMTANTNQSFSVRATAGGAAAVTLERIMASFQDVGDFRVRSPRMHDDVNGIRIAAPAGVPASLAFEGFRQKLFSQDTLTVEAVFTTAPTASDISIAGLLAYYDDVPGVAGNYKTWAEVQPAIVNYYAVPVSPTSGATAGDWGSGVAINSTEDQFKANTLYALIGYAATGLGAASNGLWAISGVDVGNLYIGGTINDDSINQRQYFVELDEDTGKASIPCFNSQNKGATQVYAATQTASTKVEVSLIFAQLDIAP